jgi:hypothetical protein
VFDGGEAGGTRQMIVFVSASLWGGIVAAAIALAFVRPLYAVRVTNGVLAAVVVLWMLLCGLGIAGQIDRGPGMDAMGRETMFDAPHNALNHVVVVLVAVAFCVSIPLAIERGVHRDGVGRLVLHVTLALATEAFVLLSAFTGYFGRPPVTDGSYLRFRLLHTMAVPFVATLALIGWFLVVRRYRRAFRPEAAIS